MHSCAAGLSAAVAGLRAEKFHQVLANNEFPFSAFALYATSASASAKEPLTSATGYFGRYPSCSSWFWIPDGSWSPFTWNMTVTPFVLIFCEAIESSDAPWLLML